MTAVLTRPKRPAGTDPGGRRRRDGSSSAGLRRLYVIAAASLAALVPLILFAGIWVRSELNKSQRDVESYLSARASALSRRVDAEMEQQLQALRAVSALPALDGTAGDFGQIAERIRSSMTHWTAFGMIDGDGRSVVATRPDWPDAKVVAKSRAVGQDRKPAIETGAELGIPDRSIYLFMPVVRDAAVRSVLITAFDSSDLQEIVTEQGREADLLTTLTDEAFRLVARSRAPDDMLGREVTGEFRANVDGKSAGAFRASSLDGEPVLTSFFRSPLTGWLSNVSISRRQIERMSTHSVWATIAAGALSLILAGILAVFIIHTVMERRVSDERLAASQALGELDARLLKTTQEALGEQRKSSSEREVLLREIYHRVKNNLQIVQSLLRLGSRDLNPEQREPFEAAVRRVGAMARVHTLLYESPDLASIDFKDYLDELLKELSEGFAADERSITSVLDAHSMRVPLDTAVPLAFIAVEILTNSYRHAFPAGRAGKISVAVRHDKPFGTMRIEDDGVGFSDKRTTKRRLGLTIVRKLVQQIGGAIEEPEPGSSTFVVRFPLEDAGAGAAGRPEPEPVS